MKKINCCRVCKSKNIIEFLDLGNQPLANLLVKNPKKKDLFYPLSLSYCSDCSLVQLNQTIEPKELFSNYVWITSTSKTAREQAEIFCDEVLCRTRSLKKSYVLEVASNDGTFLQPFSKKGYRVLGIDPAKNIVKMAIANDIPTKCGFFDIKSAEQIKKEFGSARVIIARNVLAHVANLHNFVKGLSICLAKDGLLVVEVHYAKKIYEELQYDSVYHEHLCYFSLKTLERLFGQFDLFVNDLRQSSISGGALILYLKKNKEKQSARVKSSRKAEKSLRLNQFISWKNFTKRVYQHRRQLKNILDEVVRKNGPIVGYGASARSSTLLNFCGIDTRFVYMIADQNPLKHNYFTAGTHIPIKSPDEVMRKNPEHILILAWNFAEEIIRILKSKFKFKGQCTLPLPKKPKILKVGIKK